jgi:diguanylate cyclase
MGWFTRRMPASERSVAEIETDLERHQERHDLYLLTIRALLYCIKEFSLDLTELDADRFKERIDTLTGYFLDDEKPAKLQHIFADYKDVILAYIEREKDYLRDREGEFKNIIEVLTTGLTTLTEENQEFNTRIYERSGKLEKIIYLDDIRKMKEELRQEVEQIKDYVRGKQTRDTQHLHTLSQEVHTLRLDVEKAQHASLTDGLTGAYNRLAFDMHIKKLVERDTIAPTSCAMLMLDIDNFKPINDTYGHPVGDRVIMALVQRCRTLIRKDDVLARYGGEEFVVLLHGASLRQGLKKARAICKEVAGVRYAIDEQRPHDTMTFTVSIGVSALQRGDTVEAFIERTDKALYTAKHEGKNRAVSQAQVAR